MIIEHYSVVWVGKQSNRCSLLHMPRFMELAHGHTCSKGQQQVPYNNTNKSLGVDYAK